MTKGRITPNLDSRQTSQNIDFFNTISAEQPFSEDTYTGTAGNGARTF